jgi:hypothetical protein
MHYYTPAPMLVRARQEGPDGGHAPAGIALMVREAVVGLLHAWASSSNSDTRGVGSRGVSLLLPEKMTGKGVAILPM